MLSTFLNDGEEFFEVSEDGFKLFLFLDGGYFFFLERTRFFFDWSDGYNLWFNYFLFLASDITSLLSKSRAPFGTHASFLVYPGESFWHDIDHKNTRRSIWRSGLLFGESRTQRLLSLWV